MKHLKIRMMLLLTVAIFTSCEKETTTLTQEQSLQNDGQIYLDSDMESNIDITNLPQNKASKNSISKTQSSYKTTDGTITFYADSEEFDAENCTNLQMEDFEEARVGNSIASFNGPLDENTNNYIFIPGEIVQGVYFDTDKQDRPNMAIRDFSHFPNQSKRLSANRATHNLLINFTATNITSVKLDVFLSYVSGNIDIEIYGNSGLLGSANIFAEYENGTFFGIKSIEPIVQIKIIAPDQVNFSYVWERIDNLSFGNCDFDDDGVLNENDPYPHSNMSETISIAGCNPNVNNVLVRNGTTMMDQIDALIAEINTEYNGSNYDYLHRKFIMLLERKVTDWRRNRLVNNTQRDAILRCAGSASIPYADIP